MNPFFSALQNHIRQEEQLRVDRVAQFARQRVQHAAGARLEVLAEHDAAVLVEANVGAVRAAQTWARGDEGPQGTNTTR